MVITNNNFKIAFNGLAIFFIAFSIRTCIAYLTYGGGDATNGASFIDFYNNGYDIYSNISPWPYLPFSNSLLWAWDSISNLLGNWFLMKDTDGDIKKYTTDPLARAQQMKKSANTTMETTSLSEIVNGIKQNPSNYSPIKDIQPRNRNLIEQLEAYWPKEFKKK